MTCHPYSERVARCTGLMKTAGLDVLLLAKPANMAYLTGDGRLCAYAMITKEGKVSLGVPSTDVEDVKRLACFDDLTGFEDEVGMIHSIARHFKHFEIQDGSVGLEYTFLTHSMMDMLTHPHGKPEKVVAKDCTPIMSALRIAKEDGEIERIRAAASVAVTGMAAAVKALKPGLTESQVAAEAEYAMRHAGADDFWRSYVCSGSRTNIAHGLPSQRRIEEGDLVMMDIHPIVNGYSADICRTVCVGKPTAEQRAAYDLYLKAQQATIAQVKTGVGMVELDEILHKIIKDRAITSSVRRCTASASSSRRRPCRPATPFSTARKRRRRWRPMWSSPSGTAASTPAPGGCASRIPWSSSRMDRKS